MSTHNHNYTIDVIINFFSGNAQDFAADLRQSHDIQLLVLAVAATDTRQASLQRLVGVDHPERLINVPSVDAIATELPAVRASLCRRITPLLRRRRLNDRMTLIEESDDNEHDVERRAVKRSITKVPIR